MDQLGTRGSFGRIFRMIAGLMAVGFVGLFLFCAGGGVLLVCGAQRAVVRMASEIAETERQYQLEMVRETASAFVRDLRIGDAAHAYSRLSRTFRERQTLRDWQELVGTKPIGKCLSEGKLQVNSLDAADATNCRVILVTGGGFEIGAVLEMVKEDGRWAVDRLILN